jgi:hypothetical protein
MANKVTYYMIVGVGRTADDPSGLTRRRHTTEGRVDESLRKDLSWGPTNAITDWEYGNHAGELVEINEEEAAALIERFREKWCRLANHAWPRHEGKQRVGSTLRVGLTPVNGGKSLTKR